MAILNAAFRPGGSVAAAADRFDVSRALIYLWRKQVRAGLIPGVTISEAGAAAFAPVAVVPDLPAQLELRLEEIETIAAGAGLAELSEPAPAPTASSEKKPRRNCSSICLVAGRGTSPPPVLARAAVHTACVRSART